MPKPHFIDGNTATEKERTMADATLILKDGPITVGNSSDVAADVAMSGDVTVDDTGATTIKDDVAHGGRSTITQSQGDNATKIPTTIFVMQT